MKIVQIYIVLCFVVLSEIELCYAINNRDKTKSWKAPVCQNGKSQSPIDVVTNKVKHHLLPICRGIKFNIKAQVPIETINEGDTLKTKVEFGSISLYDLQGHRGTYKVKQFHFHSPSEHSINGKLFDLEIHVVSAKTSGDSQDLTVVGVMFEKTDNEEEEAELFKEYKFPGDQLGSHVHQMALDFQSIFGKILTNTVIAYRYQGSLTTGSCSENVNWYVMKQIYKITNEKLKKFTSMWTNKQNMPNGNNRAVQPLNERIVEAIKFCSNLIDFQKKY